MNQTIQKIIKEFREKFTRMSSPAFSGFSVRQMLPTTAEDMEQFLLSSLSTLERETANDICRLLDKIESEDDNNSLEQWKQYKRIRNSIRDIYVLKDKK